MPKNLLLLLTIAMITNVTFVYADEPQPWKGEAELGVVMTSGNTETENVNGKAKVVNQSTHWRHTGRLQAANSSDDVSTTAERYFASMKSDYKINELSYVFFLLSYESDRFSGYEYQTNENLGYGRTVIKQDNLTLNLEIGAGARQSKLRLSGQTADEGVVRAAGDLSWNISESTTFIEEISTEVGEDATINKSVTALKSQIAGNLATKITYTIKNTSDVPVGIKKTDTETAITLVYSF